MGLRPPRHAGQMPGVRHRNRRYNAAGMKRFRRILFASLSGLSLLLGVAATAAWFGRSAQLDIVQFTTAGGRLWRFTSWGGSFSVERFSGWPDRQPFRRISVDTEGAV